MASICPSRIVKGWFFTKGIPALLWISIMGAAGAAPQEDTACLGCHTTRGLSAMLPSGEMLALTVNVEELRASLHGALKCTECHTNISGFPHPGNTAYDRRAFQMERYRQCQTCHPGQYKQALDSNHTRVIAAGNRDGAICVDCHGSHAVTKPNVPRQKISTECGNCHRVTYAQYLTSAHGKALLETSNPDVPVCTDCHGVHRQEDPTTQAFRLRSPKLCGKCHGDAAMMRRYNLSADVFNTYVADFHGLTVTLFETEGGNQRQNEAVCTDCHGIHDIQKASAANSGVVKQNLLKTCRRCHPDASANFPDSWVGHFPPSRDRFPLVYYVHLFYRILIPMTIGGMVVYVAMDASSRIIRRWRRRRSGSAEE